MPYKVPLKIIHFLYQYLAKLLRCTVRALVSRFADVYHYF